MRLVWIGRLAAGPQLALLADVVAMWILEVQAKHLELSKHVGNPWQQTVAVFWTDSYLAVLIDPRSSARYLKP